eukprot:XP_011666813.1 PREDICTED: uncharacterized protein LOC105439478 [Strongylocentrotus purpuratus]
MSYTRTRETVVARLKEVSGELNIGLHSLRASGATAAARAGKALSDAQVAKIEEMHTENFKFQRKGNEEQHKVNVKIHRKLKEAEDCLKESNDTSGAVAGAKGKIVEGIDLVEKRQKLIKMADSSPLGWKLVAEYERNTLADDSEDEKRMLKAETRAERKGKKVKKMAPRRFQPYDGSKASWRSNAKEQELYSSIRHGPGGSTMSTDERKKPGLCFACGKPGHWRNECQARASRDQV